MTSCLNFDQDDRKRLKLPDKAIDRLSVHLSLLSGVNISPHPDHKNCKPNQVNLARCCTHFKNLEFSTEGKGKWVNQMTNLEEGKYSCEMF